MPNETEQITLSSDPKHLTGEATSAEQENFKYRSTVPSIHYIYVCLYRKVS